MKLYISLFCLLGFGFSSYALPMIGTRSLKRETLKQEVSTTEQPQALVSFESLPELIQQGQIQVLSFTESLLEKSTDLVDDFYDLREKLQNATNARSDMKQRLRYIKQKARHMREDIEDEIEVQQEKVAKAKAVEKKLVEEKIQKLNEASSKLKSIDRLSKRTKLSMEKSRKSSRPVLQRSGIKGKSKPASTTAPSTEKKRPTIPNVGIGLGDGFGRHT